MGSGTYGQNADRFIVHYKSNVIIQISDPPGTYGQNAESSRGQIHTIFISPPAF